MADIVQDGDQGSRAVLMAALADLQTQGHSVLDGLAQARLDTLLRFQQDLSALNGRRQRAYRLPVRDIAGQFLNMATLLFAPQPLAYARGSVRRRFGAANVRERMRNYL